MARKNEPIQYDQLSYSDVDESFYINEMDLIDPDSGASKLEIVNHIVKIGGSDNVEKIEERLHQLFGDISACQKCPFCQTILIERDYERENRYNSVSSVIRGRSIKFCHNCSYWQWYFTDFFDEAPWARLFHTIFLSKVREFEKNLPDGCSEEISQWIRRRPEKWHYITPNDMEKLVANILKANYRNAEVIHVGKPDDGGVDVLFIDSNRRQWLVQVKRRMYSDHTEGVGTLRNLLGEMVLKDAAFGIIASTCDHFSYRVYEAAQRAEECGLTVKLFDRGILHRMLGGLIPRRQWLEILRREHPQIVHRFRDLDPYP